MTNNTKFKPVQIYKELHNKIGVLAKLNDVTMKVLTSKIIDRMFEMHKDEIDQIIKEIRIRKN